METQHVKTKQEIGRLVKNRDAFFELNPDMVFILQGDCTIVAMNPCALRKFGDLCGKKCHSALFNSSSKCEDSVCPAPSLSSKANLFGELIERELTGMFVECSYVPVEGYDGDNLVMVIMRDITKRKKHEHELSEFQNNLEKVLKQKIADLSENKRVRYELSNELNMLQKEVDRLQTHEEMVGESKGVREIREMVYQIAPSNATILITGESGTGKELIADLIFKHSSRKNKPYLKFNCAAISETLLESDLFGYEKGSFTGALQNRKGKFEIADGGTIFLDEIGDISPKMQAALLRVLQNGEIIRVGGTTPIQVDVRVIAATNADLTEAVEMKKFRQDLYYRLNVINLHQPPLRERKEDIVILTAHFLKKYRDAFKKDINFLPDKVINSLLVHDWPGNIRELENVIQRAVLLCKDNVIAPKDLDFKIKKLKSDYNQFLSIDDSMFSRPLKDSVADFEKKVISAAMQKWGGKTQKVSDKLNLGKTALYEKLKRYGITAKNFKI